MDELLRTYLARADAACPWCGHGLRGIAEPRCPECGRPIELALRATTADRSWTLCLLAAGTGAGTGLSMGLYLVLIAISGGSYPAWILAAFGLVTVAGLLAAVWLMRVRASWGLIRTQTRRAIAFASVVAAVGGPGVVFAMAYFV
tara:strand:+ start:5052 stop:5486 length:435 start_codon:yes stop_codon:yes gene_type:complete